jgi:hypothetical protein
MQSCKVSRRITIVFEEEQFSNLRIIELTHFYCVLLYKVCCLLLRKAQSR